MTSAEIAERLEYLRGEISAERISYGELVELKSLAEHIEPHDVELLEWAGVPEQGGFAMSTDEMVTKLMRGESLKVRTVHDFRAPIRFTITVKRSRVCSAVLGYGVNGRGPHRLLTRDQLFDWCSHLEAV